MVQTQKHKIISHAFIPFNIFTAMLIWDVFFLRIYKGKNIQVESWEVFGIYYVRILKLGGAVIKTLKLSTDLAVLTQVRASMMILCGPVSYHLHKPWFSPICSLYDYLDSPYTSGSRDIADNIAESGDKHQLPN